MAIDPNLITTIRTGELPPAVPILASKIPHEIGTDLNYFTIQELVTFLQPYVSTFQHEVKHLYVDQAYRDANFDETGLGRNLCIGWALMNGENGTDNLDGTFSMCYGEANNTLKQTGGFKNSTLPAHTHSADFGANIDFGSAITKPIRLAPVATGDGNIIPVTISSAGESAVGKNLPPFRIEIHMIKL